METTTNISFSPLFNSGDRVHCDYLNKNGLIISLRNDSYEKQMRIKNRDHYYYHVKFDDNTFDTYIFYLFLNKI